MKQFARRAGHAWRWTRYHARERVRRLARSQDRHGRWWLSLAGLACISGAAFTVALGLGLVVTGVALFALEWRVSD